MNLERARAKCFIKDSQYWDIILNEDEKPVEIHSPTNFAISTNDGYIVKIVPDFMQGYRAKFNGYVTIPSDSHLMDWVRQHPRYDDMNVYAHLPVLLTYFNLYHRIFGWSHGGYDDADLYKSRESQSDKKVTGPVQILEEARGVIEAFKAKEIQIIMEKKHAQMEIIREQLMMKACHPRRMAMWQEQGFDPFE